MGTRFQRHQFAQNIGRMILYRLISVVLSLVTIFFVFPFAYRMVAQRLGYPTFGIVSPISLVRQISESAPEIQAMLREARGQERVENGGNDRELARLAQQDLKNAGL